MMTLPLPLTKDLVLLGGGHTHALVLRMWGMNPLPGVRLTVINPYPTAAYSGMLPGFVAGHYGRDDLGIDLVRLARHAGARLILGRADALDTRARTVRVAGRPPIRFDIASIDIGISSEMPDLPGFADHAVPAKPLDSFARRWSEFATGREPASVVVIGGGVAGMELALAAGFRLAGRGRVTVVEAETALGATGDGARRAIRQRLDEAGVTLIENAPVSGISAQAVHLADGREVPSDFTIGAAATRPQGWLKQTGLTLVDGFVSVTPRLQSVDDPAVFAAGDIAHLRDDPRPKAGVFAVRQAPVLFDNLVVALTEQGTMRPYRPQGDYLKLISTGSKTAVADKWGLRLSGPWVWRWKDWIDRRFMDRLNHLPPMPRAEPPARVAAGVREALEVAGDLCGGCGAKVGGTELRSILAALPLPQRADVRSGPGDDAAVVAFDRARQVITTDHLRAFTEDPWTMARIAAVHALGDIWAMGAEPQVALAQIVLPQMSPALQAATLAEIMDAAAGIFVPEGADIVGGHTSVGAELTIGFTVTGLCDGPPVTLAGAQAGDALILTRRIGTGVLMAAEMQHTAHGADVVAALAQMATPQGTAAAILAPLAHAMTDVTGFGLAGHLLAMLDASGVAARLSLSALPLLSGAEALSEAGVKSSLYPQNRAAAGLRCNGGNGARGRLLYDPQTSGPLLAAVPEGSADDAIAALRKAGFAAAAIGQVVSGEPFVTVAD